MFKYSICVNMDSWKNLLSFINVIRCLVNVYCASLSEEWSYSNISAWSNIPKSRCGGTRQSPIDIIDAEAVSLKIALGLHFTNYNVSVDVSLENNGRTAKLGPLSFHNLTVAGAGLYLKNEFTLEEIHFHWGGTANTGSEHKFNGQSSSMEVHLVHYNLEKYSNIEMAKEKSDGVLVLSVLTEGSKNAAFNNIFKEIANELATIVNPGSKGNLANLKLQNLLPNNVRDYYIYKGSFTTPPCSETVTWIVFKEKLLILKEYLEEFRALFTIFNKTHKVRLSSNIRPVQPLNSRTVLKTFDSKYCIEHLIHLQTPGVIQLTCSLQTDTFTLELKNINRQMPLHLN